MMRDVNGPNSILRGICLRCVLLVLAGWGWCGEPVIPANDRPKMDDVAACKANLNRIFEALQEYQKVHTNLPNYFSDLHPEFIAEPRLFICPAALRTGNYLSGRSGVRSEVFEDVLPTTYSYEFCIKPYPLWCGIESTCREYKVRQAKLLGSDVPVVRCFFEGHQIFLSVGGTIFDCPSKEWEDTFTNRVEKARLLPGDMFLDHAPVPGRPFSPIPPRDGRTDSRLIDLSNFYVASLDEPWGWRNPPRIDLSALPRGCVKLDAAPVSFDIRGVVQLIMVHSNEVIAPFPERLDGIPLRQSCRRLHFLQGAVSTVTKGTEIGSFQIRYSDGQRVKIPIVYGRDVLTTWQRTASDSSDVRAIWEHEFRTEGGDSMRVRLYHQVWVNPRPEAAVDSLDFVSAKTRCAPFLVGITVEP